MAQCPVLRDLTLMDEEYLADPYATYRRLRGQPVYFSEELDAYVVTRYADVEAVFSKPGVFSSSIQLTPVTPPSAEAQQILASAGYRRPPNLINADGPRHTKVRGFVQDAMSPHRLRAMEPVVRNWAGDRIRQMKAKGRADVVADLGFPMPALVGFRILGFPQEDLEMLKSWCKDRIVFTYGRAPVSDHTRVARNVAAFWSWLRGFVAERIANPVDDLASDLVRRHFDEPDEFTPLDIVTVLFEMAVASHETTTYLLSNGLRRLLEHRDHWQAIVADPSLIPNAVEECLRYEGPVMAWRRRAACDTEIGGVAIPTGSTVLMLIGSANRDPDRFTDPETFDIRRWDARKHLTFGKGVHFCQGAPLARLEVRVVLELLATMAPELRLVEDQKLSFAPNVMLRGPKTLLVDFDRPRIVGEQPMSIAVS